MSSLHTYIYKHYNSARRRLTNDIENNLHVISEFFDLMYGIGLTICNVDKISVFECVATIHLIYNLLALLNIESTNKLH